MCAMHMGGGLPHPCGYSGPNLYLPSVSSRAGYGCVLVIAARQDASPSLTHSALLVVLIRC